MKAKTEIYSVKFNKYKLENGDVGFSLYTIGVSYQLGKAEFTPTKIEVIKDKVKVTFMDGGSHTFGYNNDVEIFRRPFVSEITQKEGITETE